MDASSAEDTENFSAYENHLKSLDEDALLAACDIYPARIVRDS